MLFCLFVLSALVATVPAISESPNQEKEPILIARGGGHPGGGPYHGHHHGGHHPQYGCFIATAAYGDPNHNHVQILREFRDKWLMDNQAGQRFVDFYYENSPKIAEFIEEHDYLKSVVKTLLLPIVGFSYCLNAAKEE